MLLLLALACAPASSDKGGAGTADSAEAPGDSVGPQETGGADTSAATVTVEALPDLGWSRPQPDPDALPDTVKTIDIEIDAAARARLDADPFHADDEAGSFIDEDGVTHEVALNYRGAYALLDVMRSYDLRNWKVKFADDDPWSNRRVWNFNYQPHLRAQLTMDLMRFAGVPVPEPEHVVLEVNGVYQGVYLSYPDPDDTRWLAEWFGDPDGDLYKATYDLPYEPQCFADLTWLGDTDADYACHYTKHTNTAVDPADVTVLREFLDPLNHLSDEDFAAWVDGAVDVDSLLSYLVVSNFVANWDSYPQRPKNYWLYQDIHGGEMVYIPWDLDATFDPSTDATFNKMGTTASLLYDLESSDYAPVDEGEGTERPLVRRLFARDGTEAAYLARYEELSATILSADYLNDRLDALEDQLEPYASSTDLSRLRSAHSDVSSFISARTAHVQADLEALP